MKEASFANVKTVEPRKVNAPWYMKALDGVGLAISIVGSALCGKNMVHEYRERNDREEALAKMDPVERAKFLQKEEELRLWREQQAAQSKGGCIGGRAARNTKPWGPDALDCATIAKW